MVRLKPRLDALESRILPPVPITWHRVQQHEGQSKDETVAAYEAEHALGPHDGVILRVFVNKPVPFATA